jgi:hypothetical protein
VASQSTGHLTGACCDSCMRWLPQPLPHGQCPGVHSMRTAAFKQLSGLQPRPPLAQSGQHPHSGT